MSRRDLEMRAAALAAAQAGVVAEWQLRGTDTPTRTRVLFESGYWVRSATAVHRLAAIPVSPAGVMWSAILASAPEEVRADPSPVLAGVTALSAAWLHGLCDNAPRTPQLLVGHHVRRESGRARMIRTRLMVPDTTVIAGVPCTSPLRMLHDVAHVLRDDPTGPTQVMTIATRADAARLLRVKDLHLVLQDPGAFALPRRLPPPFRIAASTLAAGHSHSALEAQGRRVIRQVAERLGLHATPRPHAVPDEDTPEAEIDVAVPILRWGGEIDGPVHDEPAQRAYDRRRDQTLRARWDWHIDRYGERLVRDAAALARQVEADLRAVAALRGVDLVA